MSVKKILEICCTNNNCKVWFQSPFFNGYSYVVNESAFKGLKPQCQICGSMVTVTKDNIRYRMVNNDIMFNKTS